MCSAFKKHYAWFKGLGLKSRLFYLPKPATIHQKSIMMKFRFFTLLKVCNYSIKNSKEEQIPLYSHYVKIIKEPRTSFYFLSQTLLLLGQISFSYYPGFKRNKGKYHLLFAVVSLMVSHILKLVESWLMQKS